jgi:putative zinc finger/helix-turn-helix YgiT family protein
MECPMCDGQMRERLIWQEDALKSVKLRVRTRGVKCDQCGYQSVSVGQMAGYGRAVADAYRQAQGLLTSEEIRAARERLAMSQQEFADYLGVGIASVKRWEWGQVQEKSLDKLMRLLTDAVQAERSARHLRTRVRRLKRRPVGSTDAAQLRHASARSIARSSSGPRGSGKTAAR